MTFVSNRACFYMNHLIRSESWLIESLIERLVGYFVDCWLINRLIDDLIDWLIASLTVDWLIDNFNDWLVEWLTTSMIDWLSDWQLQWLIGWLIDDFVDWLVDWLRNSVTDRLIGWLMTLLIEWWSIYWLIEAVFNIFFCPQITEYKMRWMRCGKLTDIHPWKIDRSVFEQFCIKWYSPF